MDDLIKVLEKMKQDMLVLLKEIQEIQAVKKDHLA